MEQTLQAKLAELKQQSESIIQQITEHDRASNSLREEALLLKGGHREFEKLLEELKSKEENQD